MWVSLFSPASRSRRGWIRVCVCVCLYGTGGHDVQRHPPPPSSSEVQTLAPKAYPCDDVLHLRAAATAGTARERQCVRGTGVRRK